MLGRVTRIVPADLARRVGHAVLEHVGGRVQQQARALDRIPGNADDARLLHLVLPVLVRIEHTSDLALRIVLDLQHHAVGTQFELSGLHRLGDFGVERGPFRADLAARSAESDHLAGRTPIADHRVDRRGSHLERVPRLFRAIVDDFEGVGFRLTGKAVGAGDPHLAFRPVVVRRQLIQADRPIDQIGSRHRTIGGSGSRARSPSYGWTSPPNGWWSRLPL